MMANIRRKLNLISEITKFPSRLSRFSPFRSLDPRSQLLSKNTVIHLGSDASPSQATAQQFWQVIQHIASAYIYC